MANFELQVFQHSAKKNIEYSSTGSYGVAESDLVTHWLKSLFIFLFKYR